MNTLLELMTAFAPFAKEPPKRGMLFMRLINQIISPDLAITRGSKTLAGELSREDVPFSVAHGHSEPVKFPEGLESEKERLARRSLEIQVLLATWDLSRRISVLPESAGAVKLHLGAKSLDVKAPGTRELKEAICDLLRYMEEHPVRLDEIVFEADGLDLAFPLVSPVGKFYTLLAMDVVTSVVSVPVHVIKHMLDVKRPCALDERVIPLIPVPGHASYPGGHATTTYALAVVLGEIIGATDEQKAGLECIARRISRNREKVGLHTRLDTDEGKRLGRELGDWMVKVAKEDGHAWSVIFEQATEEWKYGTSAPSPSPSSPCDWKDPQDFQAEGSSLNVGAGVEVPHDPADHLTRAADLGGDISVRQPA